MPGRPAFLEIRMDETKYTHRRDYAMEGNRPTLGKEQDDMMDGYCAQDVKVENSTNAASVTGLTIRQPL